MRSCAQTVTHQQNGREKTYFRFLLAFVGFPVSGNLETWKKPVLATASILCLTLCLKPFDIDFQVW